MSAGPEILCLGEPMVEFAEIAGESTTLYRRGFGGDTSNVAIAAARQGARVGCLTALGDDDFGRAIRSLWAAEGVADGEVVTLPDAPTGCYFISYADGAHRFSYRRAGSAASRYAPEHLPRERIAGAKILHASGISQAIGADPCDAVFEAIALARAAGVLVSYDTNYRPALWPAPRARAVIEAAIRQADLALPSLEDAQMLTGLTAPDEVLRAFAALGPKWVVLKMGADGALVLADGTVTRVPALTVDPVDTTGAGDTFVGTLLSRLAEAVPLLAAVRAAAAAGALSTLGQGAVAPMPTRAAVEAALA